MESLKQRAGPSTRSKFQQLRRRPWCLALGVAVVIAIILVIVIPLAVLLPRRGKGPKASTVLFPLYIYPENSSTWDPFYTTLTAHPELQFVVIVNPRSGPGPSPSPSDAYRQAVQRLSTFPNVQKVGYVRTGYATRNLTDVLADVATYSQWASQAPTLAMEGIFFDEVPSEYSSATADYLSHINAAAKNASGIQADRMVIHNPGTIPDERFDDPQTDVTVVFEQSYTIYDTQMRSRLADLSSSRSEYAYMLHSIPDSWSNQTLQGFINGLSRQAEYLFLTSLTQDFYESFDPRLEEFCNAVPTK